MRQSLIPPLTLAAVERVLTFLSYCALFFFCTGLIEVLACHRAQGSHGPPVVDPNCNVSLQGSTAGLSCRVVMVRGRLVGFLGHGAALLSCALPSRDLECRPVCGALSALAPKGHRGRRDLVFKKEWNKLFESWDRINAALALINNRHIKELHSLRTTRASVKQHECWIYCLWCLTDGRCYVGQTGARGQYRRTADRGRDHVRLGTNYFRTWGPNDAKMYLPADVYRWICLKGPDNFIITPLEFTTPVLARHGGCASGA